MINTIPDEKSALTDTLSTVTILDKLPCPAPLAMSQIRAGD
jgi:hypothetical protein